MLLDRPALDGHRDLAVGRPGRRGGADPQRARPRRRALAARQPRSRRRSSGAAGRLDADARRRRPRPGGAAAAAAPRAAAGVAANVGAAAGPARDRARRPGRQRPQGRCSRSSAARPRWRSRPGPTPALVIVARTRTSGDQGELAGLEAPLAALFPPPSGGTRADPGVDDQPGRRRHRARARARARAPARLRRVRRARGRVDEPPRDRRRSSSRSRALADDTAYQTALASQPAQVSSLLFADFSQLLSLGEQTGLTSGARMRELLPRPREDPRGRSELDERGDRHDRGATPPDPMNMLSDNEYLFTSESVTEGHPDKVADQISDGVLDAVLRDDPTGRVACETLVNTGLVVVSGEITTDDVRRHPGDRAGDDQADRLHQRRVRVRLPHLRGDQRDRQAVARHRPGRRPGVGGARSTPATTTSSTSPARATRG